jgi:H+/Cl- antiporter ClcA
MEKIKIPEWLHKLIISGGGCAFGIYLMHIFFLRKFSWVEKLWEIFRNEWHINYMISAFCVCGIVYLLGYIISLMLKQIPILKNLI